MRKLLCGGVAIVFAAGPVAAQSALQGPLSVPTSAIEGSAQPAKKAVHRKQKAVKAVKATPPAYGADGSGTPPEAHSIAHTPSSEDPLSFGMKWNGNNDSAKDTRVQNYDGNAAGSGAEVGMKLHF